MSKLAHSHQATMNQIEFDRATEEGNESDLAGFYWVRHQGEVRVAEWRQPTKRNWEWDFTRAEVTRRVDEIIGRIEEPVDA